MSSSSNARRSDSESERNRRHRSSKGAPRRASDEQRNDFLSAPPPPVSSAMSSSNKLFPPLLHHLAPPAPLSIHHLQQLQQQPQPLMAERRPAPPGMAIAFSGQAYTDTELLADMPRKKFTGRCRLFVGNLSPEVKEAELKELFTPHGDISECYLSGKGFAFLRLDTRAHAESAKEALDGKTIHGRQLRVRYSVHGATIKLKELSPAVSNEMLMLSFSAFGDVERAIHIVDEKGRSTGEGIVEFERKVSAQEAIAQIRERVFLMTANSRPLQADFLDQKDDEDGLCEKTIQRTPYLYKERELGPRFAQMNSFEYIYGRRWKDLYEFERKRRAEVEAELREQRRRLDADMEAEYEDYKAQMLREELIHRQEELDRLEAQRQIRRQQMQQQQLMGAGMMWEPQMVDGPLGRNMPPTFGHGGSGAGGPLPPMPRGVGGGVGGGGGGGLGMPLMMMDSSNNSNNNNNGGNSSSNANSVMPSPLSRHNLPPGLGLGFGLGGGLGGGGGGGGGAPAPPPSLVSGMGLVNRGAGGGGGAGDDAEQQQQQGGRPGSNAGPGQQQNGRGPSPQGPDVRKLLQGFRAPTHNQMGQFRGPLPPALASLLDRVPLQQQHHQQQLLPNPFGAGFLSHGGPNGVLGGPPPPGGRIPPPPPPMGGDFPPDKKSRH
ncbi:hypothetical protein niasHT_018270 [Heterodera trifolii]|uniref:RRM domain-containing protein n=1 Tax=Heterodera trifolii TaxID=157864 RepID=A0ABD2L8C4_9BILA